MGIKLIIDGTEIEAADGQTILEASLGAGLEQEFIFLISVIIQICLLLRMQLRWRCVIRDGQNFNMILVAKNTRGVVFV
jgi:hypothetical protein